MTKLTKSAVMKALEEIVEELGEDHVYPRANKTSCVYSEEGEPSCIVGRVIAKLDPDLFEKIKVVEDVRGASWTASAFNTVEAYEAELAAGNTYAIPALDCDRDVKYILRAAQTMQDSGYTYGAALREAQMKGERYDKTD